MNVWVHVICCLSEKSMQFSENPRALLFMIAHRFSGFARTKREIINDIALIGISKVIDIRKNLKD